MATSRGKAAPTRALQKPPGFSRAASAAKAPTAAQTIAAFGIDRICAAIKAGGTGGSYKAIAEAAGVQKTALFDWIAADAERSARVREARTAAAASYDEDALHGIQDAKDPFELARAKEAAQHLRWRSSKVDPKGYGDKVQVDATIGLKTVTDDALLGELGKFGIAARIGPRQEVTDD